MSKAIGALALAASLAACALPPASLVRELPDDDLAPLARLGRWDGERFVEVTAGSVPPATVRVLVHGWAPGIDRSRETHRAWELASSPEARARPFEPWLPALARTFTAHDPHAVVLAYSWIDDAATARTPFAERRALGFTEAHGATLVEALAQALDPAFEEANGQIQLVGHSYGARVAVVAAAARASEGHPIAQLTLFDAPDSVLPWISGSHAGLERLLRALPLGWGAGRTFVDNYTCIVGRRYRGALRRDPSGELRPLPFMIDVMLSPSEPAFSYRPRHRYPMEFYARTPGTGIGFDWSPLVNRSAPPPGCWAQRVPDAIALSLGCPFI